MGDGCFWIIVGIIGIIWASIEPISLLVVIGIFIIYVIVVNVKSHREYRTLMKEKAERESISPNYNNRKSNKILNQEEAKNDTTLPTIQQKKIRQYTPEYHNLLMTCAITLEIDLKLISEDNEVIKVLNDTGEVDDTTHVLQRCMMHDLLQCVVFLQNGLFKRNSLEAFGFYVVLNYILGYSGKYRTWEEWNGKYKWGTLKDDIDIYYWAYRTNPIGYAVTITNDDTVIDSYKRKSAFSIPTLLSATNNTYYLKEYANQIYSFATTISQADGIVTDVKQENLKTIFNLLHEPIPDEDIKDTVNILENKPSSLDESIEDVLSELHALIGLQAVKDEINTLINFIKIQKKREKSGLKISPVSYHIVFTGNPGTGKTTVARIVAKLYKHLGILSKGHLVETDRSGLIAEYIGQTAPKVHKTVNSALNGILFIDEAYSLVGEDKDDYGREAVATLIKRMEDDRDKLVVILAGYTEEMETFIDTNPGLQSRFNRYIEFPDYTSDELLAIFESKCKQLEYQLTAEALAKAKLMFERAYLQRTKSFGNARLVRNMFEKTIERQANRISKLSVISKDKLATIEAEDIL